MRYLHNKKIRNIKLISFDDPEYEIKFYVDDVENWVKVGGPETEEAVKYYFMTNLSEEVFMVKSDLVEMLEVLLVKS